jgi:triosephosphate isomerase
MDLSMFFFLHTTLTLTSPYYLSNKTQLSPVSAKAGAGSRSVVAMAGTGKFVVGGNWKCNGNSKSIAKLVKDLNAGEITADVEVICAPPMVYLPKVQSTLDRKYQLAAQNCWVGAGGAFTGEIAAEMLVDANIPWVILGHSERRALCGETDEFVGKKTKYALDAGLSVMACIGETLDEREAGQTLAVCTRQLQAICNEITETDWAKVVIAYEPVWAIGTGKVASPEQAQDVHAGIRAFVSKAVSQRVASAVRIQYGGSVNAGNCEALAKQEDIDGFLVGGASLVGSDFVTICNAARFNN